MYIYIYMRSKLSIAVYVLIPMVTSLYLCDYKKFLTENRPFHLPRLPRWNVDPLMSRSAGKDLERPLSTKHMA